MKLAPVSKTASPSYPVRTARFDRVVAWARRLGVAASAAALLTGVGCVDSTPIDDPLFDAGPGDGGSDSGAPVDGDVFEPEDGDIEEPVDGDVEEPTDGDIDEPTDGGLLPPIYCEPEYRLSGDYDPVHSTAFTCGEELPADASIQELPIWIGVGRLCVDERAWTRLNVTEAMRVKITIQAHHVSFELYDPEGDLAFVLDEDHLCVEIDLSPGIWTLAAPPTTIPEDPEVFFEYYIDVLGMDEE